MGAITQGERKHALGKAPAYMYLFTWKSTVDGGKWRAPHTIELPFVFGTTDKALITRTAPGSKDLSAKVSAAWAAFARTGNPGHAHLPQWQPYTPERRTTMIFDSECKAVDDPNSEELRALREAIREAIRRT